MFVPKIEQGRFKEFSEFLDEVLDRQILINVGDNFIIMVEEPLDEAVEQPTFAGCNPNTPWKCWLNVHSVIEEVWEGVHSNVGKLMTFESR